MLKATSRKKTNPDETETDDGVMVDEEAVESATDKEDVDVERGLGSIPV